MHEANTKLKRKLNWKHPATDLKAKKIPFKRITTYTDVIITIWGDYYVVIKSV